jgi:hypothetical protein
VRSIHVAVLALGVVLVVDVGCGDDQGDPERMPSAESPRLFLAGDGELWTVDVERERVEHREMPQLSPGDPPYRIVRRGERLVLWGYTTYALDSEFEGRPRPIARDSWIFIPSAAPDRVWVGFLDPASPETERALRALREVSAEGEVTVADVRPPGGAWPELALASGLLFSVDRREGGHSLEIWDPETERVVQRLSEAEIGSPATAYGDFLVSCIEPCDELLLTDVGEEQEPRSLPAPSGLLFDYWEAEFAPDGEVIAVPAHERGDGEGDRQLALVDVASGRATVVDSSTVPAGYNFVAWSASGQHVFLAGEKAFRDRVIVAHRLDDTSTDRLAVNVGAFFGMAAN